MRSSSPAGRFATTSSSKRLKRRASRCTSPALGISSTDARDARLEVEARTFFGDFEHFGVTPLHHGAALTVTRGVWRVRVDGRRAICKVVGARHETAQAASDPTQFRYWQREVLLYERGLPASYADAGFRLPALLKRFDRGDDEVALWLEDVDGCPGAAWRVADFESVARQLGRAQGAFALAPAEQEPWWSRNFLRRYLEAWAHLDYAILRDDSAWSHPLVADVVSGDVRHGVVALFEERERFLGWLERVPQTLCHLDFWPNNLFSTTSATVLIDWGFSGIAAIGEDVGNLVPDAIFDQLQPVSALRDLDSAAYRGYLAGLRDAGWDGDERLVRLGMRASAVKYCWLAPMMLMRAQRNEHRSYGGVHLDDARTQYAARFAGLALLVEWAREARGLAAELGW